MYNWINENMPCTLNYQQEKEPKERYIVSYSPEALIERPLGYMLINGYIDTANLGQKQKNWRKIQKHVKDTAESSPRIPSVVVIFLCARGGCGLFLLNSRLGGGRISGGGGISGVALNTRRSVHDPRRLRSGLLGY